LTQMMQMVHLLYLRISISLPSKSLQSFSLH
jgi:hypothetical protein